MIKLDNYEQAAQAIKNSEAIIIAAGAGMGVDSGLPDFRGNEGFWNHYPPYRQLNLNFYEAADPIHFAKEPGLGWGFYGHRTILYRSTVPHQGFALLIDWINRFNLNYFVVTSNVDGQFQKAGFMNDKILEVHGSIHHMQCTVPCSSAIWDNSEDIAVDFSSMRAQIIPSCRFCGRTARPNILMFNDYTWIPDRTDKQEDRFSVFLTNLKSTLVVLEIGAGTAVSTIRRMSENLGMRSRTVVVRINPRKYNIAPPHISLPDGALAGLERINEILIQG